MRKTCGSHSRPSGQECLSRKRANEIKIPIASEEDADFLLSEVFECVARKSAQSPIIALQPVSQDREATRLCFELCLKHNLHLSLQTHKYTDFR